MRRTITLGLALCVAGVAGVSELLEIHRQVRVKKAYRHDPPNWTSPTGESEAERYTRAFEAFWWNCIMIKAEALDARCPFLSPYFADGPRAEPVVE